MIEVRFQEVAIEALQKTSEAFLVGFFMFRFFVDLNFIFNFDLFHF